MNKTERNGVFTSWGCNLSSKTDYKVQGNTDNAVGGVSKRGDCQKKMRERGVI